MKKSDYIFLRKYLRKVKAESPFLNPEEFIDITPAEKEEIYETLLRQAADLAILKFAYRKGAASVSARSVKSAIIKIAASQYKKKNIDETTGEAFDVKFANKVMRDRKILEYTRDQLSKYEGGMSKAEMKKLSARIKANDKKVDDTTNKVKEEASAKSGKAKSEKSSSAESAKKEGIFSRIRNKAKSLYQAAKDKLRSGYEAAKNFALKAVNKLRDLGSKAKQYILDKFNAAVDYARRKWGKKKSEASVFPSHSSFRRRYGYLY